MQVDTNGIGIGQDQMVCDHLDLNCDGELETWENV